MQLQLLSGFPHIKILWTTISSYLVLFLNIHIKCWLTLVIFLLFSCLWAIAFLSLNHCVHALSWGCLAFSYLVWASINVLPTSCVKILGTSYEEDRAQDSLVKISSFSCREPAWQSSSFALWYLKSLFIDSIYVIRDVVFNSQNKLLFFLILHCYAEISTAFHMS